MRIGGLATGMDIDSLVEKLMKAERMPLDRMEQDRTTLTWKRNAFRDINKALFELENMTLEMEYSSTYNSKTISSSDESAVTATATSGASNGSYAISVTNLATSAINISQSEITIDQDTLLNDEGINNITFKTYDENGTAITHSYDVAADETLQDVLNKITEDDNNVRAFYDPQSNKVIMETTRTGNYNPNGAEIVFDPSSAFFSTLKMTGTESGGEDAQFSYNGIAMNSKDNTYTLADVTFQFKSEGTAQLTISNNVEASFEKIMEFVDKYNQVVEELNKTQREEVYRDYKPLTDEQKEAMSEDEIELWEEKAKSGILRGESAISGGLFELRRSWYSTVETGGDITSITQIGITTSKDYTDGGKLVVNEKELKEALRTDPNSVSKLFSNDTEGDSQGIINRLEGTLQAMMDKIEVRAGKGTDTLENYTLGKRMKDLDERIEAFEDRLLRVENRYWSQFTAMEKAIQRMNQQSSYLMQQFG